MTEPVCQSKYMRLDDTLDCVLPVSHTEPTGAQPQGSPHESTVLDSLTGEPWRWWG